MEIPIDKLTALVNEAFDRGLHACADLKQQEIEDLFVKYQIKENEDFRIWKVADLKKMPEGSLFHHLIRGRCWIVARANGTKFMQFDKGQVIDFNTDSDPWDKPIRLIHSSK
jgi:hypothetical protein